MAARNVPRQLGVCSSSWTTAVLTTRWWFRPLPCCPPWLCVSAQISTKVDGGPIPIAIPIAIPDPFSMHFWCWGVLPGVANVAFRLWCHSTSMISTRLGVWWPEIWNWNLEVIWECDSGFCFCSWIHGSMFFVWLEPGHCKIKAVNTRTKRWRRIDTSKKIKHQAWAAIQSQSKTERSQAQSSQHGAGGHLSY